MQSKLNISEFRSKLKDSTKIGHPKVKLSPFGIFSMFSGSSKIFYGLYDETTLSLTSNLRVNQVPFIIKGSHKNVNGKVQVQYKLTPRYKYQNYWWIFTSVLSFVFGNTTILNDNDFNIIRFTILNLFLLFLVIYAFFNISRGKRRLENNFINSFEIS